MQRLKIEVVRRKGEEVGLFLEEDNYNSGKQFLNWRCKKHGIIKKRAGDVVYKKQGCPYCSKRPPITIETVRDLVEIKKGKLVSKNYENNRQKFRIECRDGHQFEMSWTCLQREQWCPRCGRYGRREAICRAILNAIFDKRFDKAYPTWLKELSEGRVKEIDGYNEELNIAFEYHGEQHYKYLRIFHSSYADFERGQENDEIKRAIVESKVKKLIIIPYHLKTCQNITDFICQELGISKHYAFEELRKKDCFKEASEPNFVEEMKELAFKRGYIFPDQPYLGSQERHRWICKIHGEWEAVPSAIKHGGTRCPKCYGNPKYSIEHVKKWGVKVHLKILEPEFLGMNKKHRVECLKCGYKFKTLPATIRKEHGCPRCAKNAPQSIDEIRNKVLGRPIYVLSETQKNSRRMFLCHCQICGHTWSTTHYVLCEKKAGCRKCADKELSKNKTGNMEDFQQDIKKRNMQCLDDSFKGNQEYYTIKCLNCNNIWKAQGRKVRYPNGTNCPVCSRNEKRKYTIQDLNKFAKRKEGVCLNKEFINTDTKYTWQCQNGHTFQKTWYLALHTKKFCNECKR